MDIKQLLQTRANRKTRLDRPFANFFESFEQCTVAAELILNGSLDFRIVALVERSTVISCVTSIEVYYRDILDFIFRYCNPDFFKPHLKQLYPEKLDIDQLLEVYRHNVHPLELVSSAQSFQNAAGIDRAFSKFLGNGGLWSSVLKLQVRIKDDPSTESGFAHDELDALKRIFALRHELVHDPARRAYFSEEILQDMYAAAHLIFGSDIILSGVIQENRDPTMEND